MSVSPTMVAGRYRLVEPLGAGGMGRVWRAWDGVLGREVAVKEVVPPDHLTAAERDELRRRTLREARAAARLSHPNVVRVYDVFETGGRPWIVMEYVRARSLHDILTTDGPLDPVRAAAMGLGLLAALVAAHRAGVLHRDIKPSNVLLCDDGRVVLTDFGIATVEGDAAVTRTGLVLGSPAYIAPERARDGVAGPESDLWSLGATLYAAVEGRSPYQRLSAMATLAALAAEEPDPPRRAGPLRPTLDGLLRKDPATRITAAEAARRLRRAATGAPSRTIPRRLRWPRADLSGRTQRTVPRQRPADGDITPVPPASTPDRRQALGRAFAVVVLLGAAVALAADSVVVDEPARIGTARDREAGRSATGPAPSPGPDASPEPDPSPVAPDRAGSSGDRQGAGAAPPAQPGADTAPARPPLPDGWRAYTDDTGFSVYVPADWQITREGTIVYFRGDGRTLGIDQRDDPQWDPVADWERQRDRRRAAGEFPGYAEVRLELVSYGLIAADWEFTFDGRSGVRQHVNNRGVVVSQTKAYGFWWQTTDADWDDARPALDLVFDSFRPAPGG